MKNRLRLALPLLVAVLVLSAGALADSPLKVLSFLSIADKSEAAALAQPVKESATNGQVSVAVDSALFDGVMLAFDWTLTNAQPDKPAFLQAEGFTINGVKAEIDSTDSFDGVWLDENDEQGTMQDGENIDLPEGVTGDVLHVSLTVGVYYPNAPIYRMDQYDEALARQKLAEGFFVIAEEEGFLEIDPVEGLVWVMRGASKKEGGMFTYKPVTITFDVDATPGHKAAVQLKTEPSYPLGKSAVILKRAVLTPVALYLSLPVSPLTENTGALHDGKFALADAQGKLLGDYPLAEESGDVIRENSTAEPYLNYTWRNLPDGVPPESFSIAFVPNYGPVVFFMPMRR